MGSNKHRFDDEFIISDLRVLVYVIGYKNYGESTLFLILNGNDVYYSVVIDSYHIRKRENLPFINKAVDILNKYRVDHLDLLCWTHPHDDHSKGIGTILNKFCDKETVVIFPAYIQDNTADIIKLNRVSKDSIKKLLKVNKENKICANPISVVKGRYNSIDEFLISNPFDIDDTRKVTIDVITPISNRLMSYVNESFCKDPNELSITLIIDIDGYSFYFGGDTTNEHIDISNKERLKKCRFVKIPHHASETADHLLKYLPVDNLDAVCTTVFKWGKSVLPKREVIQYYQRYLRDIYSTNKDFKKNGYGIIEYEYDFATGSPACSVHTQGNVGLLDIV